MKTRILSILLLCCMVLTLLPTTVSAADAFAVQGQTATWGVFGAILKIF